MCSISSLKWQSHRDSNAFCFNDFTKKYLVQVSPFAKFVFYDSLFSSVLPRWVVAVEILMSSENCKSKRKWEKPPMYVRSKRGTRITFAHAKHADISMWCSYSSHEKHSLVQALVPSQRPATEIEAWVQYVRYVYEHVSTNKSRVKNFIDSSILSWARSKVKIWTHSWL